MEETSSSGSSQDTLNFTWQLCTLHRLQRITSAMAKVEMETKILARSYCHHVGFYLF